MWRTVLFLKKSLTYYKAFHRENVIMKYIEDGKTRNFILHGEIKLQILVIFSYQSSAHYYYITYVHIPVSKDVIGICSSQHNYYCLYEKYSWYRYINFCFKNPAKCPCKYVHTSSSLCCFLSSSFLRYLQVHQPYISPPCLFVQSLFYIKKVKDIDPEQK